MRISLSDFERSETVEQFDKAYDGLWNSSDVDFTIFSVIFSKLISFGITAYIFSSVHWAVAVFVAATLITEFILSVRLSERLASKGSTAVEADSQKKLVCPIPSLTARPIKRCF